MGVVLSGYCGLRVNRNERNNMQFNFNASEAPEMRTGGTYGPLPEGQYEMVITRTDVKPTKAGTGEYLEAEMQVVDGEFSGRRHWERFNVSNPNKQAEDIAKAALGALCNAVGITNITDTDQLHDVPFVAMLELDRKDPTRNRIVAYMAAGQSKPAAQPAAPQRPAAAPTVAKTARPWAK
jgi:hypothetical protein